MSSENLPSPSRAIHWTAPLPWTWGLVVVLLGVHGLTGLMEWSRGYESLFDALVMDRSMRMRVAVGGQLDLNITQGELFRFVSSTVLHGDMLHVLVNVLALFGLGRIVEPLIGGRRFFTVFSLGAVGASIGSYFSGVLQSDGASAGAFALLGFAVLIGLRYRHEWDEESRRIMGPILQIFVGLNLVLSLVLPFVDGLGHVYGLMLGLAMGPWMLRPAGALRRGFEWFWLVFYAAVLWFGALWVGLGWTAQSWSEFWMG